MERGKSPETINDHLLLKELQDAYDRVCEAQQISQALAQENTLKSVLSRIMDHVPKVMRCDACEIFLPDGNAGMLRRQEIVADNALPVPGLQVPIDSSTDLAVCFKERKPILVGETLSKAPEGESTSVLILPLLLGYESIGVMLLRDLMGARDWTDHDIQIGMLVASLSGAALEKARLFQSVKARESRYRVLVQIGQTIASALRPEEVIVKIIESARTLTGERPVKIFLLDEDQGRLAVATPDGGSGGFMRLDEESIASRAFHQRMVLREEGQGTPDNRRIFPEEPSLRSIVAAPLSIREQVLGVMVFGDREGDRPLLNEELGLVETLCNQAAIAIEKIYLLRESSRQKRDLELLSKRLLQIQEDERRRIARELHDETGQSLTAIKIALGILLEDMPQTMDSLRDQVISLRNQIDQSIEGVRRLSYELRPSILDDLGFLSTLRWYADRFMKRTGIKVDLDLLAFEGRLDSEIETALYRVTQEILTNVARHAEAQRTIITLKQVPGSLQYIVEDDGKGFDPDAVQQSPDGHGGLGLMGIRERVSLLGGVCTIRSVPGYGTTVAITIPLRVQEHT